MLAKRPIRRRKNSTQQTDSGKGISTNSGAAFTEKEMTKKSPANGSRFALIVDSMEKVSNGPISNKESQTCVTKEANDKTDVGIVSSNKGKDTTLARDSHLKETAASDASQIVVGPTTSMHSKEKTTLASKSGSKLVILNNSKTKAKDKNKGPSKSSYTNFEKLKEAQVLSKPTSTTMHGNKQYHANPDLPIHSSTPNLSHIGNVSLPPPQSPNCAPTLEGSNVHISMEMETTQMPTSNSINLNTQPMDAD